MVTRIGSWKWACGQLQGPCCHVCSFVTFGQLGGISTSNKDQCRLHSLSGTQVKRLDVLWFTTGQLHLWVAAPHTKPKPNPKSVQWPWEYWLIDWLIDSVIHSLCNFSSSAILSVCSYQVKYLTFSPPALKEPLLFVQSAFVNKGQVITFHFSFDFNKHLRHLLQWK